MKAISTISVIFTLLLICLVNLKAKIIYTDINPDTTISVTSGIQMSYYLDLNNDGQFDFDFRHFNPGFMKAVEVYCYPDGNIEGVLCDYQTPKALNLKEEIGPSAGTWVNTFSGSVNSALFLISDDLPGSAWDNAKDKYIGLRFQLSGNWFYGWARLDISAGVSSFTIKDYAYNDVPNEMIKAGSVMSGVSNDSEENNKIKLFPNPADEYIYINFPDNSNIYDIIICNILGENIISSKYHKNDKIDIFCLSPGVYFMKFINPITNEIFMKKFIKK